MDRFDSAQALGQLLDDLYEFQDIYCDSVFPPPGGADTPHRVELVMRDVVSGGPDPGAVRTSRITRLTATGVREWSFSGEHFYHAADHCIDGADLIETGDGFGLAFGLPTPVRLVASAFESERLPDVIDVVPAWTSDSWLFVTAPRAGVPSPGQWVEAMVREGTEVSWRYLGGPAHPSDRVPADYTGWFLERPSRLTENDQGVFVDHVGATAKGVDMSLERKGADDELWRSLCRSVARLFPDGEFYSGNCRFTAEQWLAHLEGGDE
jgi:hypothetical protein